MKIDYDKYSLIHNDKRIFVNSAALHYFRSPGAKLWIDRLSKLKAAGYNTVDLYFNWGYHSQEEGVYDFTDIKDIRILLDIALELDLFVIARPGPFINAEVSAGGLPLWLFNKKGVIPRNRKDGDFVYSKEYMAALKEWYKRIIPILNEYHNIIAFQIENEYSTNEAEPDYIQELHDLAREMGIKAPIFHNDAYNACLYSDIVNIYASDVYPLINPYQDWKSDPYCFDTLDNYEDNIRSCKDHSPLFIAEMQSGWFDKWGGEGHERIRNSLGSEHINIVTKTALSQGITMFNHYMGCGGTSWGNLACNEVYTSYDFAAPVREEGTLGENYFKAKEINYFLNSFRLFCTDFEANEGQLLKDPQPNIFARLRRDSLNNCKWLFVRNLNNESVNVAIKDNKNVHLQSFDMKILPIELDFMACRLNFSSLSILGKISHNQREVVFVILEKQGYLEFSHYEKCDCSEKISMVQKTDSCQLKFDEEFNAELASCKFEKNGHTTEFVFLSQQHADKTWLFNDKALIGADMVFDSPFKAGFSQNSTVKTIDLKNNNGWKTTQIVDVSQGNLPILKDFKVFNCAPEIDSHYNTDDWNFIKTKTDSLSNELFDEFCWYKGYFNGHFHQIEICAKHCYAVYLNGNKIFEHDDMHCEEQRESQEFLTINLESKMFNKHENEITVLIQNLGFDKGFCNDTNLPRGLISFKTIPSKEIEWKVRSNLTPELEEWDFVPIDELEDSSGNSFLQMITTEFSLPQNENSYSPLYISLENSEIERASIYLNGYKIGRYWKNKGPQDKFYLIDSFLKANNRLSLIIWNKNDKQQQITDCKLRQNNVNIKIGAFASYKTVELVNLFCT